MGPLPKTSFNITPTARPLDVRPGPELAWFWLELQVDAGGVIGRLPVGSGTLDDVVDGTRQPTVDDDHTGN